MYLFLTCCLTFFFIYFLLSASVYFCRECMTYSLIFISLSFFFIFIFLIVPETLLPQYVIPVLCILAFTGLIALSLLLAKRLGE